MCGLDQQVSLVTFIPNPITWMRIHRDAIYGVDQRLNLTNTTVTSDHTQSEQPLIDEDSTTVWLNCCTFSIMRRMHIPPTDGVYLRTGLADVGRDDAGSFALTGFLRRKAIVA